MIFFVYCVFHSSLYVFLVPRPYMIHSVVGREQRRG